MPWSPIQPKKHNCRKSSGSGGVGGDMEVGVREGMGWTKSEEVWGVGSMGVGDYVSITDFLHWIATHFLSQFLTITSILYAIKSIQMWSEMGLFHIQEFIFSSQLITFFFWTIKINQISWLLKYLCEWCLPWLCHEVFFCNLFCCTSYNLRE